MILTYRYRVKDKTSAKHLRRMAGAVITRAEARATGLPRYFTGKPCKHGHTAPRATINATCIVCLEDIRKRMGPEARKRLNARHYAKNGDAIRAQNARWREDNPERMTKIRRAYYLANKGDYRAYSSLRKKHVKRATPPWADMDAIKAVYRKAVRLTAETGIPHDVDHIEPLRGHNTCGLHVPWNLRVIPAKQNRGKDNNRRWLIRQWTCSECGALHDRDVNAARNLLLLAGAERRPLAEEIPVL